MAAWRPTQPERTIEAAEEIAQLLRYLNDAAGRTDAVPRPSTVAPSALRDRGAAGELDQLLHRLLGWLELAGSTAHDDRQDRPAADTVYEAGRQAGRRRVRRARPLVADVRGCAAGGGRARSGSQR